MAKGKPVTIVAVCKASSPPPIKSTAATVPSVTAQKIRWPITSVRVAGTA